MQDIGQDQFLMLLLVIETDLQNAQHLRELRIVDIVEQPHDLLIDIGAILR